MSLVLKFFSKLTILLCKWTLLFVLWVGSTLVVLASQELIDTFSQLGSHLSMETVNSKNKRMESHRKSQVKRSSKVIKSKGRNIIGRNVTDAAVGAVPVAGAIVGVSLSAWDIVDMCSTMEEMRKVREVMGVEDAEPDGVGEYCQWATDYLGL